MQNKNDSTNAVAVSDVISNEFGDALDNQDFEQVVVNTLNYADSLLQAELPADSLNEALKQLKSRLRAEDVETCLLAIRLVAEATLDMIKKQKTA